MDAQFNITCDHALGVPVQRFTLLTCPRCLGAGVYNAYSLDTSGKIITPSGIPLLQQQIKKILTEDIEKRGTGYGFNLSLLSGVINDNSITAVKAEVMRCLQYLWDSQSNEISEGYKYKPSERISSISNLEAYVSADDPRKVIVSVSVITESGDIAEVNLPIRK